MQLLLSGVYFWGRKCVKTALFYCAHCAVPPSPSGATHAIPDPEMYTTEYVSTSYVYCNWVSLTECTKKEFAIPKAKASVLIL